MIYNLTYPVLKESRQLRYFAFFYMYVMQGVPAGFALTAIANYLSGKGVSPSSVGTFIALVGMPWALQFVWGPLIDRYQYSIIGHRKQWVVLAQFVAFLASLSLLLIDDPVRQLYLMTAAFFIHSVFASIQDASVDAVAIDIIQENERGRINGFMRGGFIIGISLGAAVLSSIIHSYGFFYAALTQSAFLLFFTVITFFIKIDRHDQIFPSTKNRYVTDRSPHNPELGLLFKDLYKSIIRPKSLRMFVSIALAYFAISVFIRSYSFHLIHVLKWPDRELSVMQGSLGSLAVLSVALVGGVLADRIGPKKLLFWVMIVICSFLLIFNGMTQFWSFKPFSTLGLVLLNVADPMLSVAAIPLLMSLCAKNIAGSQFTTYMAMINLCDILGAYASGWTITFMTAPVIGLWSGLLLLSLSLNNYYQIRRQVPT